MRLAALLLSLLIFPAQSAVTLSATNLGFEKWNADKTLPEGWNGNVAGYRASCDANEPREGACTLKIESLPDKPAASRALPMLQAIPAVEVGGHPLKLSGWIRTDKLEGVAAIFLRVDQDGKVTAFENMKGREPTGNTGWQKFEVTVPVPKNATRVLIGAAMNGSGTAWFDGLALEVDEAVKVPDLAGGPAAPSGTAIDPAKVTGALLRQERFVSGTTFYWQCVYSVAGKQTTITLNESCPATFSFDVKTRS